MWFPFSSAPVLSRPQPLCSHGFGDTCNNSLTSSLIMFTLLWLSPLTPLVLLTLPYPSRLLRPPVLPSWAASWWKSDFNCKGLLKRSAGSCCDCCFQLRASSSPHLFKVVLCSIFLTGQINKLERRELGKIKFITQSRQIPIIFLILCGQGENVHLSLFLDNSKIK